MADLEGHGAGGGAKIGATDGDAAAQQRNSQHLPALWEHHRV